MATTERRSRCGCFSPSLPLQTIKPDRETSWMMMPKQPLQKVTTVGKNVVAGGASDAENDCSTINRANMCRCRRRTVIESTVILCCVPKSCALGHDSRLDSAELHYRLTTPGACSAFVCLSSRAALASIRVKFACTEAFRLACSSKDNRRLLAECSRRESNPHKLYLVGGSSSKVFQFG